VQDLKFVVIPALLRIALKDFVMKVDKYSSLVQQGTRRAVVCEVFMIHVGGARCVTWSIDRIIQIHVCITWGVEFIRAIFFIFFLYV
jgi:hypothetical protein